MSWATDGIGPGSKAWARAEEEKKSDGSNSRSISFDRKGRGRSSHSSPSSADEAAEDAALRAELVNSKLRDELSRLKSVLQAQQQGGSASHADIARHANMAGRLERAEEEVGQLRQELAATVEERERWIGKTAKAKQKRERAKEDAAAVRAEMAAQRDELEAELQALSEQLDESRAQHAALDRERERLEAELRAEVRRTQRRGEREARERTEAAVGVVRSLLAAEIFALERGGPGGGRLGPARALDADGAVETRDYASVLVQLDGMHADVEAMSRERDSALEKLGKSRAKADRCREAERAAVELSHRLQAEIDASKKSEKPEIWREHFRNSEAWRERAEQAEAALEDSKEEMAALRQDAVASSEAYDDAMDQSAKARETKSNALAKLAEMRCDHAAAKMQCASLRLSARRRDEQLSECRAQLVALGGSGGGPYNPERAAAALARARAASAAAGGPATAAQWAASRLLDDTNDEGRVEPAPRLADIDVAPRVTPSSSLVRTASIDERFMQQQQQHSGGGYAPPQPEPAPAAQPVPASGFGSSGGIRQNPLAKPRIGGDGKGPPPETLLDRIKVGAADASQRVTQAVNEHEGARRISIALSGVGGVGGGGGSAEAEGWFAKKVQQTGRRVSQSLQGSEALRALTGPATSSRRTSEGSDTTEGGSPTTFGSLGSKSPGSSGGTTAAARIRASFAGAQHALGGLAARPGSSPSPSTGSSYLDNLEGQAAALAAAERANVRASQMFKKPIDVAALMAEEDMLAALPEDGSTYGNSTSPFNSTSAGGSTNPFSERHEGGSTNPFSGRTSEAPRLAPRDSGVGAFMAGEDDEDDDDDEVRPADDDDDDDDAPRPTGRAGGKPPLPKTPQSKAMWPDEAAFASLPQIRPGSAKRSSPDAAAGVGLEPPMASFPPPPLRRRSIDEQMSSMQHAAQQPTQAQLEEKRRHDDERRRREGEERARRDVQVQAEAVARKQVAQAREKEAALAREREERARQQLQASKQRAERERAQRQLERRAEEDCKRDEAARAEKAAASGRAAKRAAEEEARQRRAAEIEAEQQRAEEARVRAAEERAHQKAAARPAADGDGLSDFLEALDLGHHMELLRCYGYDDVEDIFEMEADEVEEMGSVLGTAGMPPDDWQALAAALGSGEATQPLASLHAQRQPSGGAPNSRDRRSSIGAASRAVAVSLGDAAAGMGRRLSSAVPPMPVRMESHEDKAEAAKRIQAIARGRNAREARPPMTEAEQRAAAKEEADARRSRLLGSDEKPKAERQKSGGAKGGSRPPSSNPFGEALTGLVERGEKFEELGHRTDKLSREAEEFADNARKLRERESKRAAWSPF